MLTNISDFTLSRVESKFDTNKANDGLEFFSPNDIEDFNVMNVFETATNRVRSRVQITSQVNSNHLDRHRVLDMPSLDLISDVSVSNHADLISKSTHTEFKVDYFPGWEPIITPTGGRIYSARKMTEKQRMLNKKRLNNLNRPQTPGFLDRTKSFLFPSNTQHPVKGCVDTTN